MIQKPLMFAFASACMFGMRFTRLLLNGVLQNDNQSLTGVAATAHVSLLYLVALVRLCN